MLGEISHEIRIKRNINQEKLIYGICSQATYSKFEQGRKSLTVNGIIRLFQRLGVSIKNYTFLINKKDYEYLKWKENIIELIHTGDLDEVEDVIERGKEKFAASLVEQQFIEFIDGYIHEDLEKIKSAILLTVPRVNNISFREICVGIDELKYILFYWDMQAKWQDNVDVLIRCITYSDLYFDEEEQMYVMPYELYLLNKLQLSENEKLFATYFENKLIELAEKYHINTEGITEEKAIFQVGEFRYCLRSEYFKNRRWELGLTQEKLSEGICSVDTYSRFENGVQEPSDKNLRAIAERLEIEWDCAVKKS